MKKPTPSGISVISAEAPAPSHSALLPLKNLKRHRSLTPATPTENGSEEKRPLSDHLDSEQILLVLTSLKKGNFSVRLPVIWTGTAGRVADAFNDVAEMLASAT